MKKSLTQTLQIASISLLISLSSCVKDVDLSQPTPKPVKGDYFDFQTTLDCPINIDLELEDYPVLIEVYGENPFKDTDGVIIKKDIEPLYRGITDEQGKLEGQTVLPSYLKKAYIYSPYVGVPFIETEITANGIFADVHTAKSQTRAAVTRSMPYTYPADMKVIGDWDVFGYPAYLTPNRFNFPENELYYITEAIKIKDYSKGMRGAHPEYFDPGNERGIPIIKKTKVNLVMIGKYAPAVSNTIIYYTYPTGQEPASVNDIQKIIAYPVSAGISCGSTVQLRYWNEQAGKFEDEFPEGVTIGWGVSSSSFKDGNVGSSGGNHNYYSTDKLNTRSGDENAQHTIAIFNKDYSSVIIGMEDRPIANISNYTDVVLYLHTDVSGAIGGNNIPDLEKPENPGPSEEDNYTTYFGMLSFEDLWPKEGDYDMNDVVIYYESKVYKNDKNQIIATEDLILPYWDGAGYDKFNGFGYQLSVTPDKVNSVQITSENYEFTSSPLFQFDSKGLEERVDNDNAIIILADDMKKATKQHSKFIVKTTFASPQSESTFLLPPYNPFIIIDAHEERGKELHLPNYAPTKRMDTSYFGTKNDISDPAQQMYYIGKENMPYAINIPNIKDFDYKKEEEGTRIDMLYPEFTRWVQSHGTENADWYLHKKK